MTDELPERATRSGDQDSAEPAASPSHGPRRSRYAFAAVRVLLVAGACVGLVRLADTSAWSLDLTQAGDGPAGAARQVALSDRELSCPGGELSGVSGATNVATSPLVSAAVPPPDVLSLVGAGAATAGRLTLGPLTGKPAVTATDRAGGRTSPGGAAVLVHGTGGLAPGLVASQESLLSGSRARGLVDVACGPPATDVWLVGGGGQPGRQERLVVVNPGANEVTVDVAVLGANGPVTSAAGHNIVIPSHGRVAVLIDAIAGAEPSPVLHVTVNGGQVRATLNDTWLDGTIPAGSSDAFPTAAPGRDLVLPGVAVDGGGLVRVANPGTSSAVVQVRTLDTEGGAPLPGRGVVTVPAHTVIDVPLTGVPSGVVAVEVTSDVPVLAGALVTRRAGSAPGDFAWTTATAPIVGLGGAALPASGSSPTRTVQLVATGGAASVTVTTVSATGVAKSTRHALVADTTESVALGDAAAVWVVPTGAGAVRAAVVSTVGTGAAQQVAILPMTTAPTDATRNEVTVEP